MEQLSEVATILSEYEMFDRSKLHCSINYKRLYSHITWCLYNECVINEVDIVSMLRHYVTLEKPTKKDITYLNQSFEYGKLLTPRDALIELNFNVGLMQLNTFSHHVGLLLALVYPKKTLIEILSDFKLLF